MTPLTSVKKPPQQSSKASRQANRSRSQHPKADPWLQAQASTTSGRPFDPLLECLLMIAKKERRSISAEAILAGLPLVGQCLTPDLMPRAADRAQLSARLFKRKILDLQPSLLPAILLLKDHGACVLLEIYRGGSARVIFPETGEGETIVPMAELERRYQGYVCFVKPKYRFDSRAAPARRSTRRHWFWGVMLSAWPAYTEILLASLLINLFALAIPLYVMNVYDRVVPNQALETLWVLSIGLAIVFCFDFVLRGLRGFFIDTVGKRIDKKLSALTFAHILGIKVAKQPTSSGSLANTLQGFEAFRDFITSSTISALVDIPFTILFLVAIGMIGGALVIVPVAVIPLIILSGVFIQVPLAKLVQQSYRHSAEKQAITYESLGNLEAIKGMCAEGLIQGKWERVITKAGETNVKLRSLSNLAVNLALFLQYFATIAVVVTGVYLISHGELTIGALIACTILSSRALSPMMQVIGLINRYHQTSASLHGLDQLMQLPPERPMDKAYLNREHIGGEVEFKRISFHYPQQSVNVLEQVSFNIQSSERVAFVGRTGSGKSTIIKLLMQFYNPTSGSILVDKTRVEQIDPNFLRQHVAYIPQDVVLFHGSIKDNIVSGAPYVTDEAILKVAKIAGVYDFMREHPDGLDRQVGECGRYLSGGQRQAVAVARALLGDPQLLIFDEPCNSLDDRSTALLISRLQQYLQDQTLILVTHKSSMIKLVDRLIVLEQGHIIADGPKATVLQQLKSAKGQSMQEKVN